MKSEIYFVMLNDRKEYLEIISVGVTRPSKPMHSLNTGK